MGASKRSNARCTELRRERSACLVLVDVLSWFVWRLLPPGYRTGMETLTKLRDRVPAIADAVHDNTASIEGAVRHASAILADVYHDAAKTVRPAPKRQRRVWVLLVAMAGGIAVAAILLRKQRRATNPDEFISGERETAGTTRSWPHVARAG